MVAEVFAGRVHEVGAEPTTQDLQVDSVPRAEGELVDAARIIAVGGRT